MIDAELVGGPEDGRRMALSAPLPRLELYTDPPQRIDVVGTEDREPVPVGVMFTTYRLAYVRGGVHYYDHERLRRG